MGLEKMRKASSAETSTNSSEGRSLLIRLIDETVQSEAFHKTTPDDKKLADEIEQIYSDRELARYALHRLFPEGVNSDERFWKRLVNLQLRLGWGESSHRVVGLFIPLAVETLRVPESEALLRAVTNVQGPGFFQLLDSLLPLMRETDLRPEFIAEWLPSLLHRIGNDLAVGGFWTAVHILCEHHPATALRTLELLSRASGNDEISVGAYILGSLRCLELKEADFADLRSVDQQIANATATTARAVYHRSWVPTAWCGKLGLSELRALAERMWGGTPEEREQLFWIVCRSLLSPSLPPDASEFGWQWLREHVSSEITPTAKYNVVDFAGQLPPEKRADGAKLILEVQPILPEHKGIWKELEQFLVSLLGSDVDLFNQTLENLARRNGENLLTVLREPRDFEWLLSEMQTKNVGSAIAELMLTDDSNCRRVGLLLFDEVGTTLPSETFEKASQNQIALAFYEVQRSVTHGTAVARFLIFLIPFVERASPAFRQEFYDELLVQLKNFPGACKDEFAARASDFPILQKAIAEAEKYFEALGTIRESSINQIEVAGFARAAQLHARRFAEQVSKGAEELSIFTKLFKKVRLLYGHRWRTFHDGVLGASSDLKQISTPMEFPRMEFVDPEGMQLRRFHASLRIRELSMDSKVGTER